MFVIPCKYSERATFIKDLVNSTKHFHPDEKIVVVDSSSQNKDYLAELQALGVIVEDIDNTNWCVGAYWYVYKKYPDESFYYFMHDSMKVKGNLDFIKKNDLTIMAFFDRKIDRSFNMWSDKIEKTTPFKYRFEGLGCYGPIFFCANHVMQKLLEYNVDQILPTNKHEIGHAEGAYGFFFEELGYSLRECALFGDVIENESPHGRSGLYPHNTSWQTPIEKFYGHHSTNDRL